MKGIVAVPRLVNRDAAGLWVELEVLDAFYLGVLEHVGEHGLDEHGARSSVVAVLLA